MIPRCKIKKVRLRERVRRHSPDIEIIEIDIDQTLETQGPFHVFIHKAGDYTRDGLTATETEEMIRNTVDYCHQHPEIVLVDDIALIWKLTSRNYQFEILRKCAMMVGKVRVYVPQTVLIPADCTIDEVFKSVEKSRLTFPLLAKSVASSIAEDAHRMTLVFSKDRICDLPTPCLLQEFRNHDGVIYKVFVMGDKIHMCERPSVMDLNCDPERETLVFDTRDISKTNKVFVPGLHKTDPTRRSWMSSFSAHISGSGGGGRNGGHPELLDTAVIRALVERVSKVTSGGLKLYGLDVLKDKNGNYAVVDLNHFPGYTGVDEDDFVRNIVDIIKQSVVSNKTTIIF